MFEIRRATLADAQMLFEWRNDPVTRNNFESTDVVSWDVHVDWLTKSLNNPRRLLFIGIDSRPVGTSRIDLDDELFAELSYTIAPEYRSNGYGHKIVSETIKSLDAPFVARVKPSNLASRAILEKAGFVLNGDNFGLLLYTRRG